MSGALAQVSSEIVRRGRMRASEGMAAASLTYRGSTHNTTATQQLWAASQADANSGPAKTARILEWMERAAVRPRRVRSGPSGNGWWSNEYEDLVYC